MKNNIKHTFLILFLTLFVACNSTKFVNNGEYLLNRVDVKSDNKDIPNSDIEQYIRQYPNSKVLGLFKMQLGIYNLSSKDTTAKLSNWLKKIGDEPVIYDKNMTLLSEFAIKQHCSNSGYMSAVVSSTVSHPKDKQANITYTVRANKPYTINSYNVNIEQSELEKVAKDSIKTEIKVGSLFNSYTLNKERDRITTTFRNLGYYNFTKDRLHFYADSSKVSQKIDVVLEVINEPLKADSSENIFNKYIINRVNFINKKFQGFDGNNSYKSRTDSITLDHYTFNYEDGINIRPNILIQTTHITPRLTYSDKIVDRTYSSLNTLGSIKYTDIRFNKISNEKLDCYITLSPAKLQSFSADLEGTYSAGYLGVGGNLNYGHKNIFKGSETLSLQGRAAYEYQGENQHSYELGATAGIKFPIFLLPFLSRETRRNIRANTQININYNFRKRPSEYTGIVTGVGLKYEWNEKQNIKHNLDIMDLSYVYYPYISDRYKEYLKNSPYFSYNFQNHFIMRFGYSGSYSQLSRSNPNKSYITMTYAVETAGNLLNGLNHLFNTTKGNDGFYKLFGIRYAQYAKADYHLTYNQIFDPSNRIVYHAGIGIAIPYGNSGSVPFEKRYFAGGANGVRGWTSYQLGPGTYKRAGGYIDYNTQMGDIKIDLNMEYRTRLFWKFDGALFIDAGNVWTIKEYENQKGGAFKIDQFIPQMGVAYGVGVRADFSFVVLRADLGIKLYNPVLSRTERLRTKLNSNDFALNIAIGYPF